MGCSAPLTTREKGTAIGTVGGGAGLGLETVTLIGDRVQALEKNQSNLDEQIKQNQLELERPREELERLKKETKER